MDNLRAISGDHKIHDLGASLLILCPNLLTREKIRVIDVNYEIARTQAMLPICDGGVLLSRLEFLHSCEGLFRHEKSPRWGSN